MPHLIGSKKSLLSVQTFETLESRELFSTSLKHVAKQPAAAVAKPVYEVAKPLASANPAGSSYTPAQLRTAYGFDQLSLPGVAGDGAGQTIAIVDAYDNPNFVNTGSANFASSDLHKFDLAFGLADPPSFIKVNQTGGTTMPAVDTGWDGEIALDVEWAHAIAPAANLVLVEASSSSTSNLISKAVNYARSRSDVSVVSMSFGLDEYSGESSLDTYFQTPANHQGITFVASTGDNGSPGGYPAYSPNVVAVGGTSLSLNRSTGVYIGETGWGNGTSSSTLGGTGGGISSYIGQPSYQTGVVTQTTTRRATPDLSMVADPYTGVAVYDTANSGASTPWIQVGGTSLAAPLFGATVAIADQARVANGLTTLDGRSQTLPKIYAMAATDFHDITTGSNGAYSAGAGYDLVTGRGSPIANLFVSDLAGVIAAKVSVSAPDLTTASDSGVSNTDNLTNDNTPTFTGTATPGSAVTLFAGTTQVGSTTTDLSGTYSVTSGALSDGTYNFTIKAAVGSTSTVSSSLSLTIDATAPTASSPVFGYQTSQSLSYTFSEQLGSDPSPADLTLLNTTTGQTIATVATYDAATRTVTYVFPNGILTDGEYQPTFSATLKDLAGNTIAAAAGTFSFLDGDANGDGVVDSADFTVLSSNFNKTGATFSDGDFNYDHTVNALDYSALSSNFGTQVSNTGAIANATPAAQSVQQQSLFGTTKIADSTLIDVI